MLPLDFPGQSHWIRTGTRAGQGSGHALFSAQGTLADCRRSATAGAREPSGLGVLREVTPALDAVTFLLPNVLGQGTAQQRPHRAPALRLCTIYSRTLC